MVILSKNDDGLIMIKMFVSRFSSSYKIVKVKSALKETIFS